MMFSEKEAIALKGRDIAFNKSYWDAIKLIKSYEDDTINFLFEQYINESCDQCGDFGHFDYECKA